MRKRSIAIIMAAIMVIAMFPVNLSGYEVEQDFLIADEEVEPMNTVAHTFRAPPNRHANSAPSGRVNGFDYESWTDDRGADGATMTLYTDGTFRGTWENTYNTLFRVGRRWPANERPRISEVSNASVEYRATRFTSNRGATYLTLYGWTTDPMIEWYVIDGWRNWVPSASNRDYTSHGTVTANGATYDIITAWRVNQPSLEGNRTFLQIFSVRRNSENRTTPITGTIDVAAHFEAWRAIPEQSITTGGTTHRSRLLSSSRLYEISFTVEGFGGDNRSSGEGTIDRLCMRIGNDRPCTRGGCSHCTGGGTPTPSATPRPTSTPTPTTWTPVINSDYFAARGATVTATNTGLNVTSRGTGEHDHNNGLFIDIPALRELRGGSPDIVVTGTVSGTTAGRLDMQGTGRSASVTASNRSFSITVPADVEIEAPWTGATNFPFLGTCADLNNVNFTVTGVTVGGVTIIDLLSGNFTPNLLPYNMQTDPNWSSITSATLHPLMRGSNASEPPTVSTNPRELNFATRTGTSQGLRIRAAALFDSLSRTQNVIQIEYTGRLSASGASQIRLEGVAAPNAWTQATSGSNNSFTQTVTLTHGQLEATMAAGNGDITLGATPSDVGLTITGITITEVPAPVVTPTPTPSTTPSPTPTTAATPSPTPEQTFPPIAYILTDVTPPTAPVLTQAQSENAQTVIDALPQTISVMVGQTALWDEVIPMMTFPPPQPRNLQLNWTSSEFDSTAGAENDFNWEIILGDILPGNQQVTGTLSVKNFIGLSPTPAPTPEQTFPPIAYILTDVTPPTAPVLTQAQSENAQTVIDALPQTISVMVGQIALWDEVIPMMTFPPPQPTDLPLDWATDEFDSTPGAENDFNWKIVLGDILPGNQQVTGTLSVKNFTGLSPTPAPTPEQTFPPIAYVLTDVTPPTAPVLTQAQSENAQTVIDALPQTISVVVGQTALWDEVIPMMTFPPPQPRDLPLNWTSSEFDSTAGAENDFNWEIVLGDILPGNQQVTGTLSVKNFEASGIPPEITAYEPPPATDGVPYNFRFEASGTPSIWSVAEGSILPTGLSLREDGTLSGIPVFSGVYTFTVVADNGETATKDVSMSIYPRPSGNNNTPTISVSSAFAEKGESFDIFFRIENNPGFSELILAIDVPLIDNNLRPVVLGPPVLGSEDMENHPDLQLNSVFHGTNYLTLTSKTGTFDEDGTILRITLFSTEITPKEFITIPAEILSARDKDGEIITDFVVENGGVTIRDLVMGDVNGDGRVTSADSTVLARSIIDPSTVVDHEAANITGSYIQINNLVALARRLIGLD